MAKNNPEWFCERLTIEDTKVLSDADIERERLEGMSENLIQQEFYCSFDQGIEGAYYAKLLNQADLQGRITNVPHEPMTPVLTFWDLGVGDETVILFVQQVGQEIHIINMYKNTGEGLAHYAKVLKKYADDFNYHYSDHYAPHDIQVREIGSGAQTRLEIARELGIVFNIVPNLPIQEGIELARGIFGKIWIDQKNCNYLIKSLENYHRAYNEKHNVFSERPVHDWSSHSADCFRYMSIILNVRRQKTMTEYDANRLEDLYFRNYR